MLNPFSQASISESYFIQATQQTQGIQTLLEAEKEADKVVQQARQCTLRHNDLCIVQMVYCSM